MYLTLGVNELYISVIILLVLLHGPSEELKGVDIVYTRCQNWVEMRYTPLKSYFFLKALKIPLAVLLQISGCHYFVLKLMYNMPYLTPMFLMYFLPLYTYCFIYIIYYLFIIYSFI